MNVVSQGKQQALASYLWPEFETLACLDLKYKSEQFPASLTEEESLLKFRIELIIDYLKGELGWR